MFQSKPKLPNLIDGKIYDAGSRIATSKEMRLANLSFHVSKITSRPEISRRNTVIFPIFSEFGSEILMPVYILPKLMQERYRGKKSIVLTWFGRKFLYSHLVDEVWELDEKHQPLREMCRAFHHNSINLKRCEKLLEHYGNVVSSNEYGYIAVGQLYKNIKEFKKSAVWLPEPSLEKINHIKQFIKPNSVGITARNRKCYGRNFKWDFYKSIIDLIKSMGYNPVWMGERQTTLKCEDSSILDFTQMEESNDLEYTFALTKQLKFTLQFFTASTRIASLSSVPQILFESDQQVLSSGQGQEMQRLLLTDRSNLLKLVVSHFWNMYDNPEIAVRHVAKAIDEINEGNYSILIGQVDNPDYIKFLIDTDTRFEK